MTWILNVPKSHTGALTNDGSLTGSRYLSITNNQSLAGH